MQFRRKQNPHKSLGLGEFRPLEIGDKLQSLQDLYWVAFSKNEWSLERQHPRDTVSISKGLLSTIIGINDDNDNLIRVSNTIGQWIYTHKFSKEQLLEYFIRI